MRKLLPFICGALLLPLAGCGQDGGKLAPVRGRVFYRGKPLPGGTIVFTPDPSAYKQLAANPLGEASNSTPAVSNGQLFIRTAGHLWCIEEAK